MPELPEVEVTARNVRRWTAGRRVQAFELLDPRLLHPSSLTPAALEGAAVQRVWRRAKLLLMETSAGALVWHLRMTGKLVPARPGGRIRARLTLDDGARIAFKDSRCLGELWLVPLAELEAFLSGRGFGPEPYPEPQPGAWWAARLQGLRGPLKPALMRQDRVAGLGNIAGSELCWRAGLHPSRAVPSLDSADFEALALAAHAFLHEIVALEDGDEIAYLNDGPRGAPNPFSVYGREGQPCPRCGDEVLRMSQAGRSTFWCAGCQGAAEGAT